MASFLLKNPSHCFDSLLQYITLSLMCSLKFYFSPQELTSRIITLEKSK